MPAEIEILKILQIALLAVFLCVIGLFFILSVVNRRRLNDVLVTLPVGPVFGLPLLPILFAAALVGILIAGVLLGAKVSTFLIAGYLVGAVLWGIATYLSTSIFVFDFGIIRGLADKAACLPWSRVEDYFCHEGKHRRVPYVFLYRDEVGRQRRFEVRVPRSRVVEFAEIVDDILETRFTARRQRSRSRRRVKGV